MARNMARKITTETEEGIDKNYKVGL